MKIDFTTPCNPDIFSMSTEVQDTGAIIRREIQNLYKAAREKSAWLERNGGRSILQHYVPQQQRAMNEAWDAYEALYEAYHHWSRSASGTFKSNPDLLSSVTRC
jgi:hypothetical protein